MKICFVLPRYKREVSGGYKIVYEYANRLCKKGHRISILFINEETFIHYKIPSFMKKIGSLIMTQIEPKWFNLDKRIQKISGWDFNLTRKIENVDIAVATSVETVPFVEGTFKDQKTVYLIQDYEIWNTLETEVKNSYKKLDINIVVSRWLKKMVDNNSCQESILIPNAIDANQFRYRIPYDSRERHSVAFLYHEGKHKGVKFVLDSINQLYQKYDDLKVYAFGTFPRKSSIPDYIKYTYCATSEQIEDICNKARVFLCASIAEGFGLTGLEAMSCGAVYVSTDYDAVHEYAEDGFNALLSPIEDVDALVNNVINVFEDEILGKRLSANGVKTAKKFSWELSSDMFEQVLIRLLDGNN